MRSSHRETLIRVGADTSDLLKDIKKAWAEIGKSDNFKNIVDEAVQKKFESIANSIKDAEKRTVELEKALSSVNSNDSVKQLIKDYRTLNSMLTMLSGVVGDINGKNLTPTQLVANFELVIDNLSQYTDMLRDMQIISQAAFQKMGSSASSSIGDVKEQLKQATEQLKNYEDQLKKLSRMQKEMGSLSTYDFNASPLEKKKNEKANKLDVSDVNNLPSKEEIIEYAQWLINQYQNISSTIDSLNEIDASAARSKMTEIAKALLSLDEAMMSIESQSGSVYKTANGSPLDLLSALEESGLDKNYGEILTNITDTYDGLELAGDEYLSYLSKQNQELGKLIDEQQAKVNELNQQLPGKGKVGTNLFGLKNGKIVVPVELKDTIESLQPELEALINGLNRYAEYTPIKLKLDFEAEIQRAREAIAAFYSDSKEAAPDVARISSYASPLYQKSSKGVGKYGDMLKFVNMDLFNPDIDELAQQVAKKRNYSQKNVGQDYVTIVRDGLALLSQINNANKEVTELEKEISKGESTKESSQKLADLHTLIAEKKQELDDVIYALDEFEDIIAKFYSKLDFLTEGKKIKNVDDVGVFSFSGFYKDIDKAGGYDYEKIGVEVDMLRDLSKEITPVNIVDEKEIQEVTETTEKMQDLTVLAQQLAGLIGTNGGGKTALDPEQFQKISETVDKFAETLESIRSLLSETFKPEAVAGFTKAIADLNEQLKTTLSQFQEYLKNEQAVEAKRDRRQQKRQMAAQEDEDLSDDEKAYKSALKRYRSTYVSSIYDNFDLEGAVQRNTLKTNQARINGQNADKLAIQLQQEIELYNSRLEQDEAELEELQKVIYELGAALGKTEDEIDDVLLGVMMAADWETKSVSRSRENRGAQFGDKITEQLFKAEEAQIKQDEKAAEKAQRDAEKALNAYDKKLRSMQNSFLRATTSRIGANGQKMSLSSILGFDSENLGALFGNISQDQLSTVREIQEEVLKLFSDMNSFDFSGLTQDESDKVITGFQDRFNKIKETIKSFNQTLEEQANKPEVKVIPDNALPDYKDIKTVEQFSTAVNDYLKKTEGISDVQGKFSANGKQWVGTYKDAEGVIHEVTLALDEQNGVILKNTAEVSKSSQEWQNLSADITKGLSSGIRSIGQFAATFVTFGMATHGAMMMVRESIQQGKTALMDYDKSLTAIKYTMNMSEKEFDALGKATVQMARDLRLGIQDAMMISQVYANMKTTSEEILEIARPTAILSNLTGVGTEQAANYIQSVQQQFNMLESDAAHIVDVYDKVSAAIKMDYSRGVANIAGGVQAAGQVAHDAGLSFEELAAIIGKVTERTREEGSAIGNSLKTIITRISKASKLSGADEVDNETISKAAKALHDVGVEVYNADGSFRNLRVILQELAAVWGDLTDAQRANISFEVAATRQTNKFKAILTSMTDSMELATEATEALGNAEANQEKYLESMGGLMQGIKTEMETLWINLYNDDVIKSGLKAVLEFTKGLNDLREEAGATGLALRAGFAVIGASAVKGFVSGISKDLTKKAAASLAGAIFSDELKKKVQQEGAQVFSSAVISSISTPVLVMAGTVMAGLVIAGAIAEAKRQEAAQKKAAIDSIGGLTEQRASFEQTIKQIEDLQKKLQDQNLTEEQRYDIKSQLKDIQDELNSTYGKEAEGLDLVNEKLEDQLEIINNLVASGYKEWLDEIQDGGIFTKKKTNKQLADEAEERLRIPYQGIIATQTNSSGSYTYNGKGVADFVRDTGLSYNAGYLYANGMTAPETVKAMERLVDSLDEALRKVGRDSDEYKYLDAFRTDVLSGLQTLSESVEGDQTLVAKRTEAEFMVNNPAFERDIQRYNTIIDKASDDMAKAIQDKNIDAAKKVLESTEDSAKNIYSYVNNIEKTAERIKLGEQYNNVTNGNIDYNKRTAIYGGEMTKNGWGNFYPDELITTFDSDYETANSKFTVKITPILDDGTILSPEALAEYVEGLNEDSLEALLASDTKGIVIHALEGNYEANKEIFEGLNIELDEIKQKDAELLQQTEQWLYLRDKMAEGENLRGTYQAFADAQDARSNISQVVSGFQSKNVSRSAIEDKLAGKEVEFNKSTGLVYNALISAADEYGLAVEEVIKLVDVLIGKQNELGDDTDHASNAWESAADRARGLTEIIKSLQDAESSGGTADLTNEQLNLLDQYKEKYYGLDEIRQKSSKDYIAALQSIQHLEAETVNLDRLKAMKEAMDRVFVNSEDSREPMLIKAVLDTDGATKKLDEFLDRDYELEVGITEDIGVQTDQIVEKLDGLALAFESIGTGLQVAKEDVASFAAMFPEVAAQAMVLADGTLQLTDELVNQAYDTVNAEVDAAQEGALARIEAEKQVLLAKADAADAAANAAIAAADAIAAGDADSAEKRAQYEEELANYQALCEDDKQLNSIATGEVEGDVAKEVADNFNTNFANMAESSADAYSSMMGNNADWANQAIENARLVSEAIQSANAGLEVNVGGATSGSTGSAYTGKAGEATHTVESRESKRSDNTVKDAIEAREAAAQALRDQAEVLRQQANGLREEAGKLTVNESDLKSALDKYRKGASGARSGGNSSGSGSGGDGSGSEKEKKDPKELDWIQRRIDLLEKQHEIENEIASDEEQSYAERIAALEAMRQQDEFILETLRAGAEEYKTTYEEAFDKIKELAGENETLADVIGDVDTIDELREAIENGAIAIDMYGEEAYDAIDTAISAWDKYQDQLDEVRKKEKENHDHLMEEYRLRIQEIQEYNSYVQAQGQSLQNELSLIEARGQVVTASIYRDLIYNSQEQIGYYEEQMDVYEELLDELDEGSAEYNQTLASIQECANSIQQCELNQVEWNEAIKKIPIERIEKYLGIVKNIKSDITNWITLHEEMGEIIGEDTYKQLISLSDAEIKKLEEEKKLYEEIQKDYKFGSEKYKEAADAIQGIEDEVVALKQSQVEWNEEIRNIPIKNIESYLSTLRNIKQDVQNLISEQEAMGKVVGADVFNKLIQLSSDEVKKLIEQQKLLKANLKNYSYGSDKYAEIETQIQNIDNTIADLINSTTEWNRSILEIPINKLNEVTEQLTLMKDALDDVIDDYDTVLSGVSYLLDEEKKKIEEQREEYEKMMDERVEGLKDQAQGIQDVIDALTKENEERQKVLAVEQAEYDLDRANTQKSVQIIQDGQRKFIADQEAIRQAQQELNEATYQRHLYELQQQIEALNDEIDALEKEKEAKFEEYQKELDFLDQQAEKWSTIVSSIEGARDMLMSLQYLGKGWDTKILTGKDDAIYNKFYKDYQTVFNQSDAYSKQIESNERIADLMSAYVDAFISGSLSYNKVFSGLKSLSANIDDRLLALENVTETRKLLGGASVDSILSSYENQAQNEANNYPEYLKLVQSNNNLFAKYTESWDQLKNEVASEKAELEKQYKELVGIKENTALKEDIEAQRALLEKQWKELQETKEATTKVSSTVRHSDRDGGNAVTVAGEYAIVNSSGLVGYHHSDGSVNMDRPESTYVYHDGIDGGAVGKVSDVDKVKILKSMALKPMDANEIPALLKAGEVVLNGAQQSTLLSNIGKVGQLGSRVETAPVVNLTMSNLTFHEINNGQDFANFLTKNLSSAVAQGLSRR